MKNLTVDFSTRIKLSNVLSLQEGSLGRLAPFNRVLDKVRFSDEESKSIKTTQQNGLVLYTGPDNRPDFGKIQIALEDADASAVTALLQSWERFTTADVGWTSKLLDGLK